MLNIHENLASFIGWRIKKMLFSNLMIGVAFVHTAKQIKINSILYVWDKGFNSNKEELEQNGWIVDLVSR
jgi:hypothetical protein